MCLLYPILWYVNEGLWFIGSICQLTTWNGDVVEVQMPLQARCKVVEISQSGGQTIAKLENGMDVNVPTFVDVGDVIVVTTDDGKYVSRE